MAQKCHGIIAREGSQYLSVRLYGQGNEAYIAVFAQVNQNSLKEPQGFKAIMMSDLTVVSTRNRETLIGHLRIPVQTEPLKGWKLSVLVAPVTRDNSNLILDPRNRPSVNLVATCNVTGKEYLALRRFDPRQFQVVTTKGAHNDIVIRNGRAEKVRR